MSKSLKKKNHWTNKVHEALLGRNKEGELGFDLKGGAENGNFPYFGEVKQGKVAIQSGKLSQDELLLEVNDTPVAGLTIRDVLAVIKHCKDPFRLKCVKQGEEKHQTPFLSTCVMCECVCERETTAVWSCCLHIIIITTDPVYTQRCFQIWFGDRLWPQALYCQLKLRYSGLSYRRVNANWSFVRILRTVVLWYGEGCGVFFSPCWRYFGPAGLP